MISTAIHLQFLSLVRCIIIGIIALLKPLQKLLHITLLLRTGKREA